METIKDSYGNKFGIVHVSNLIPEVTESGEFSGRFRILLNESPVIGKRFMLVYDEGKEGLPYIDPTRILVTATLKGLDPDFRKGGVLTLEI